MTRFLNGLPFRIALLLCLLLGANTTIFLKLFGSHLDNEVAPQMARAIADHLAGIRAWLSAMPEAQRSKWLELYNATPDVTLSLAPEGAPQGYPPKNFYVRLELELRKRLGADTRLRVEDVHGAPVRIDFSVGSERYEYYLPPTALAPKAFWPFFWLIVSTVLIIWLTVRFSIWQINRPLQRSAESLARSANQLAEIEMPASAPREFLVFAERFNTLARRLAAQERERTLVLAGVSHDLRAPLTRIRLRAELLDDPSSSSGMTRDAESMRRIIDQFLDFQRSVLLKPAKPVDVGTVVEGVVSRNRELGNAIELQLDHAATMQADAAALERVLDNLIDNALTHGAEPVEIRLAEDDGGILLEVRDHGRGIQPDQIERALRPFERLDDARGAHGHCGLGLSIVQRLVEGMGGRLIVTNHAGGGLLVRMRFPPEGRKAEPVTE